MPIEEQDVIRDRYAIVFAGPNGSGKSTLIEEICATGFQTLRGVFPVPAHFINPDQVAKDLVGEFPDQQARDVAAQAEAIRLRIAATESGKTYAFETVMSHPSRLTEMLILKENNYRVFLTFISTDDPEKNVRRVTERYENGLTTGHYVLPDKVRARYHKTHALLPRAVEIADAIYIYDNSADFAKASLQAVIEEEELFSVSPEAKAWITDGLIASLNRRRQNLEEIFLELEKIKPTIGETNELDGAYTGPVILVSEHFLVQRDAVTSLCIIHDRLMLDTKEAGDGALPAYSEGETLTISYSRRNGPRVERQQ